MKTNSFDLRWHKVKDGEILVVTNNKGKMIDSLGHWYIDGTIDHWSKPAKGLYKKEENK